MSECLSECLEALAIGVRKAIEVRAIYIEDTEQIAVCGEGYHYFAVRCRVAGYMPLKFMDVGHYERSSIFGGGPAHTLAHRDLDAGRLSLKCVQDKLFAVIKIKSCPIYAFEAFVQ